MKGIIAAVAAGLILLISAISGLFASLVVMRYNVMTHVLTQIHNNQAEFALLSLLSAKEGDKSYSEILVEKIVKNEDINMKPLIEPFGFNCYKVYIKEYNKILAEKECREIKASAKTELPLPNGKHCTLVLEVG